MASLLLASVFASACHDAPPAPSLPSAAMRDGGPLPTLVGAKRVCPVGFRLRNALLGESGYLGSRDAPSGEPQALELTEHRSNSPQRQVWTIEPVAGVDSAVRLQNARPPNGFLSRALDVRSADARSDALDGATDEFTWVLRVSGYGANRNLELDAVYQLRDARHPEYTLEVNVEGGLAILGFGPAELDSQAQWWTFSEFELCDL